jgi:hypothetical protein
MVRNVHMFVGTVIVPMTVLHILLPAVITLYFYPSDQCTIHKYSIKTSRGHTVTVRRSTDAQTGVHRLWNHNFCAWLSEQRGRVRNWGKLSQEKVTKACGVVCSIVHKTVRMWGTALVKCDHNRRRRHVDVLDINTSLDETVRKSEKKKKKRLVRF